jgi:hypothetical protein
MSDFKARVTALLDAAITSLETSLDFSTPANVKNLETIAKIVAMTETWGSSASSLDEKSIADLEAMLDD